jgi:hypothetical protein
LVREATADALYRDATIGFDSIDVVCDGAEVG